MKKAFGPDDQWVAFNSYTYLVHTDKPFDDLKVLIGLNMKDDIDDFMLIQLDYESAMSTFTDRHDIIDLLRSIKPELRTANRKPTQEEVNALLDKLGAVGKEGMDPRELELLSRF